MKDLTLIAEICLCYEYCTDCPLFDIRGGCLLQRLPQFWDTKKINKILDENRGETNADD
ncbi:MAG: hypothetical protein J6Y81_11315 [Ruminococcus sp.]|nr:hypothetical protein [Ruminococcus sp.]